MSERDPLIKSMKGILQNRRCLYCEIKDTCESIYKEFGDHLCYIFYKIIEKGIEK